MNSLTAENSVSTIQFETVSLPSKTRGLIAKWVKVDGKLVCQWQLAQR